MPSDHGHARPARSPDALNAPLRRHSMGDVQAVQPSRRIEPVPQWSSTSLALPGPSTRDRQGESSRHAEDPRGLEMRQPALYDHDTNDAISAPSLFDIQVSESSSNVPIDLHHVHESRSRSRIQLPPLIPTSPTRPAVTPVRSQASPLSPVSAGQNSINRMAAPMPLRYEGNNFPQPRRARRSGILEFVERTFAFFGYGTGDRYRKELVSLVWTLSFGFVQLVVTLAFLIYSGIHRSPTDHSISEWKACSRPLGAWGCLWIAKILLDCPLAYWGWWRDWRKPRQPVDASPSDAERGADGSLPLNATSPPEQLEASVNEFTRRRRETAVRNAKLYTRLCFLLNFIIVGWFLLANIFIYTSLDSCRHDSPHLWWLIFSLVCIQYFMIAELIILSLFAFIIAPLIYLTWNIILLCLNRHPAQNPHYIDPEIEKLPKKIVDEIPLVLYIPCPPDDEIIGEVGEEEEIVKPEPVYMSDHKSPIESQTSLPKPAVTTERQQRPRRHRFIPLRLFRRNNNNRNVISEKSGVQHKDVQMDDFEKGKMDGAVPPNRRRIVWEDYWEPGEYPFVRLEENRAACAICLLDFEAPRRVSADVIRSWAEQNRRQRSQENVNGELNGSTVPDAAAEREGSNVRSSLSLSHGIDDAPAATTTTTTSDEGAMDFSDGGVGNDVQALYLEDAGNGPQPLRLLGCGHVFHKTCIDPWLIDVSGRCPTCQRPIIPSEDEPYKSRRRF